MLKEYKEIQESDLLLLSSTGLSDDAAYYSCLDQMINGGKIGTKRRVPPENLPVLMSQDHLEK